MCDSGLLFVIKLSHWTLSFLGICKLYNSLEAGCASIIRWKKGGKDRTRLGLLDRDSLDHWKMKEDTSRIYILLLSSFMWEIDMQGGIKTTVTSVNITYHQWDERV